LTALIGQGALGQKTRCGIFRKQGKEIQVLDLAKRDYRASAGEIAEEVAAILKIKNPAEKFAALRASSQPQAKFLWAIFCDIFHYAAVQLENVADNARDLDFAMRWGFGWSQGPFETWQAAGWADIAQAVAADIAAGKTMSAHAAAGLGHGKRPDGCAYGARFLLSQQECLCRAFGVAGLSAPTFPRACVG
jgi:3-hydroxyacyl-CoA dehydrogenase